ncbi:Barstar (barnase inhibitor) [Streptomyces sp. WMMB 714]|uniref:barstar family protein n=1 Tax=Streptomyces sp. WMMB 714 TaxID=1286822 RepID=UPI0005F81698|nr:barstar family protein [Streptomyces sp. WMMB 714]SCK30931.1 Barstar (barnase inhibitor) [Streptomyces sp. WMMB 714]
MTSPVDLPELPELPGEGLPGLFEGTVPPGVYRCDSVGPDVLMQAEAADWTGAVIDLSDVTTKAEFMDRCATGLEFPDWFGRNWDALADSLTDLSWWGETNGYMLMTAGWPGFEQADPASAVTAVNVFTAAVGYWTVRSAPLTVLLG